MTPQIQLQPQLHPQNFFDQVKIEQEKLKEKIPRAKILEFQKRNRHSLVTTRFTTETWNQNRKFIDSMKNKYKCVYCAPCPMAKRIVPESIVFVLEMNNDTNEIMGIGMIQNKPNQGKKIYSDNNYNRCTYFGKYRIDRKEMNQDENNVIIWLEKQCFYGRTHLKRGQGITTFPFSTLYKCFYGENKENKENTDKETENTEIQKDVIHFIVEMFKRRYL
jgi:hypothetical protein